jgi:outer membrane protein assembly factor BamB
MRTFRKSLFIAAACLLLSQSVVSSANQIQPLLDQIGVARGICVLLGDSDCELALQLARKSELMVYIQLPLAEDVQAARKIADEAGLYGNRIFIEEGSLEQLHLADNLADALITIGKAANISEAEALRVLCPAGKALLGSKVLVKPFPKGVDDWSHPYHGPDNNPQSQDKVIVAPYLTQFLAEPRYAPLPQVSVASNGRVFKAFGHVAFKKREEPFLNKLVAFNGYNGTMLWQCDLAEGVMIHRNTMIATPATLYIGDDKSCKMIDTATGRLKDEIVPPVELAGGTFWKWMGMEDGVLYALMGEQEQRDPTRRWRREAHGWPWNPISKGFNQPDGIEGNRKAYQTHPWGFGRNVLAINPDTKKVLWSYRENEPIDSRAMCMKNGRIYIFRFDTYLACLNAKTGDVIWRKTPDNASELFATLGSYSNRQDWRTNWRTTCYLKCSGKALYFSGPQVNKLLAVSTKDGSVLWEYPYNNFQLVLREDGLYGLSGQIDKGSLSMKFDPLTGKVLAELKTGRRACTRPTGSPDAILYRASGGSTRLDVASGSPQLISPMRPQCHDGVTIANGLLYWWPSVCDCQLTLYGITSLAPAGGFDFYATATEEQRLEKGSDDLTNVASLSESPADWPVFRADNQGSATSTAAVPDRVKLLWRFEPKGEFSDAVPPQTAPVSTGGLVFTAGPDGIVRAFDAESGDLHWKAYTGGAVRIAPTIWKGRAFVGSGDGWVYAFEAKTGRLLWRFRAAPAQRTIPVYDSLLSTWPAASGVLVEDGIAYAAAGIVNYDGTYVFALDAETGKIKWQNNTSGHLNRQARTGISVHGHMILYNDKLYLAGGNAVSPAVYDTADGKCLNDDNAVRALVQNNLVASQAPRGWELSLLGDQVVACGKPFYAHPKYNVYDATVFDKVFLTTSNGRNVVWVSNQNNKKILCFDEIDKKLLRAKMQNPSNRFNINWSRLGIKDKPLWDYDCKESVAMAVCKNAVVVACKSEIVALDLQGGKVLWSHGVPVPPVTWGLAIDREGRAIVSLEDGHILCLGSGGGRLLSARLK